MQSGLHKMDNCFIRSFLRARLPHRELSASLRARDKQKPLAARLESIGIDDNAC